MYLPRRTLLAVALLAGLVTCSRVTWAWNGFDLEGMGFSEARQVIIHAPDATRLAARLIVPSRPAGGGRLPAVVMIDQWAARPGDFLVQAVRFASEGYVVLVYQPRGYGHSAGSMDLGGPRDLQDFGAVLDWLVLHAPVDEARIGVLGASTGGVISLIAAGQDPLVKAVAALGAWSGLAESIHVAGAGRAAWRQYLEPGGMPRRMDPRVTQPVERLLAGDRGRDLSRWAEDRSPRTWLELINRRMVPVLLTASYADELVHVNGVLRFYESLQGPRRLLLARGRHAEPESEGSLRTDDYLWNQVLDWMNRWLQPGDGLRPVTVMSMELDDGAVRDEFSEWPVTQIEHGEFFLSPRGAAGSGGLDLRPWQGAQPISNALRSSSQEVSTAAPGAAHGADVAWLPSLDHRRTMIYESAALTRQLPIRGIPKLRVQFKPSTPAVQLVASLYDVNNLGLGRKISHAVLHLEGLEPNREMETELEFRALAHDIEAGNHLALVLDTQDPGYLMPEVPGFVFHLLFSESHQPVLRVPYNQLLTSDPGRLARFEPGQ